MFDLLVPVLLIACSAFAKPPSEKPGTCPAKREQIVPGQRCAAKPAGACQFADGSSCSCHSRVCASGAGPIPNCKPELIWECRDDGCSADFPSGACDVEGKVCDYSKQCIVRATCTRGKWVEFQGPCAPRRAWTPQR